MNDTPGWAPPGSAPSDGQGGGASDPAEETGPPSRWSAQQPAPGQWAPPAAPGPKAQGPAAGWGGTGPGGRQPVWGRPPAAKPGVIPLRPLGVGEILDGSVSAMRAHWRTVLGLTVTVAVVAQICDMLVQRYLLPDPVQLDPNPTPSQALDQATDALRSSLLALAPSLAITLISTLFITAVLTVVISRSVLGRGVTLSDAWREARPRLPQLLGLTLLLPLISVAIMTVAILPGILIGSDGGIALSVLCGVAAFVVVLWLMVRFNLASPALMLERQGVLASMRRSARLVRGSWWRIFGILLLTLLLTTLVSMIISVPFGLVGSAVDGTSVGSLLSGSSPDYGWPYLIVTGVGAVIASSITYPISAGVAVLLYIDQRIRREALDLELARAAGLPATGATGRAQDPAEADGVSVTGRHRPRSG